MGFSTEWEKTYQAGAHNSVWPWSDVVSMTNHYFRGDKHGLRILELGCGAGANIPFFASIGAEYCGIEGSVTAVERLQKRFPMKENTNEYTQNEFKSSITVCAGDFSELLPFEGEFDLILDRGSVTHIPESIIEENQARRFISQPRKEYIHCDLEYYPAMGLGSIIFGAFHFALFTMPKQIFLVGCDCAPTGHYDGSGEVSNDCVSVILNSWKWVKEFVDRFYPNVEVISVNPVGLKGMFHDVYTESYLAAHPELHREDCEILDID